MIVRGRVQNGVVVLDEGVHLPDRMEVIVLGTDTASATRLAHSVLDIPAVLLGPVLHVPTAEDELLGEMLDGRQ